MNTDEQRIRDLAHQIWESEGKPHGQHTRHWEMACKLADAGKQKISRPGNGTGPRRVTKPKEAPLASAIAAAGADVQIAREQGVSGKAEPKTAPRSPSRATSKKSKTDESDNKVAPVRKPPKK